MMKVKLLVLSALFIQACSSGTKTSSDPAVIKVDAQEVKISPAEQKKQAEIKEEIEKSLKTNVNESEQKFKAAHKSQNEQNMLRAAAEMLSVNAENQEVLFGLADHYMRKNLPDAARIFYSRILEKNPTHPEVNNNLGVLSLREDKEFEATVYFKRALQSNRRLTSANFNLGTYYLKYFDYDKAVRFLEQAYNSDSKNYDIANNYAIALRGLGQIDKALDIYKSIEGKSANSVSMLNQAVLLAEFKKDYKSAKEIISKIRFITTDPTILRKVNILVQKIDESEKKQ